MSILHILTSLWLLVGSYSAADQEGIKVYQFDTETAQTTFVSGLSGISNPSFLCLSQDGRRLYAVGEDEGETATANYLRFDKRRGRLKFVESRPTHGGAPCHITLSPDGQMLFTANYMGGSITAYRLDRRGRLGQPQPYPFEGSSAHPVRQTRPYLHAVYFTPDGRQMWCDDLGTDFIHVFPMGPDGRPQLDRDHQRDHFTKSLLGPRHLCFAPQGQRAYLLGELSGEVCTLDYSEEGRIQLVQALRADSLGAGGSADIHISPDGRFVYTSHRLKGDGLSILRVKDDGTLAKIGYQPTASHPRNFTITPDGRYLLVACRDADEIAVYHRHIFSGLLTDTRLRIHTPKPVCLLFCQP